MECAPPIGTEWRASRVYPLGSGCDRSHGSGRKTAGIFNAVQELFNGCLMDPVRQFLGAIEYHPVRAARNDFQR